MHNFYPFLHSGQQFWKCFYVQLTYVGRKHFGKHCVLGPFLLSFYGLMWCFVANGVRKFNMVCYFFKGISRSNSF